MPDVAGIELARQIRALGRAAPPLVLVGGHGREDLRPAAREAGIDASSSSRSPSLLFDTWSAARPSGGRTPPARAGGYGRRQAGPHPAARCACAAGQDNDLNQEVAAGILRLAGLMVDIAGNGQIALDKVAHNAYDLVLMDMQMPVMDGITATRVKSAARRAAALPIVAMTANARASDRERCLPPAWSTSSPSRSSPRNWAACCCAGSRPSRPARPPVRPRPMRRSCSAARCCRFRAWTWPRACAA
jgi:two-component system sensor histidine kinase/response regulator